MRKGGKSFTPALIVKLIFEAIDLYHCAILGPPRGSGGKFVNSAEFVRQYREAP